MARTQADLERLRRDSPDWASEVDAAITAFNASDIDAAKAAFARIDNLIAERRVELLAEEANLRIEAARSKHAQATLFYPFEASRAEPLLSAAAELAQTNFNYWIECGRARVAVGNLYSATMAFSAAHDIARHENHERNISVALNSLGNVRRAQGDLPGALEVYSEGLDLARSLAARDPGNAEWARDVLVSLIKIGDVRVSQGDLPGALEVYVEGLDLARSLAARDPGNAGWARDVSVSLNKIGDVRVSQGDLPGALEVYVEGLGLARSLAARDPGNAGWARDVSVSLNKIGDVRVSQGDLPGALEVYVEGLALVRSLAARDPGNAEWARDVSVSLDRIGDVRRAQGDLPGALEVYVEGLALRRGLAARDSGNAGWARDLIVSHAKLSQVDPDNAAHHWSEAVRIVEDMDARNILAPVDRWMLDDTRANLAAAKTASAENPPR